MIVSTKGRYAMRLMLALAQNGDYVPLKEVAKREEIPYKYAESLTTALVKAGLLEALRGKNGGYRLARAPEEITAADVLAAAEPSLYAVGCLKTPCPRSDRCPTLSLWRALDDTVTDFLSGYPLSALLKN